MGSVLSCQCECGEGTEQPDEQAVGPYLEAEEEIIKFRMSQTADR